MLLPDQPYFTLIERLIPSPGETCQLIASSLEKTEQESIDKEIAKRRIRLGANLDQVTKDVKKEVLGKSEVIQAQYTETDPKIEDIYQKIIDWSENIEIRRIYETKLLQHAWDTLLACSPEEKDMRRDTVWRIAHGMVVLNLPDQLAWTICLDWRDFESIGITKTCIIQH